MSTQVKASKGMNVPLPKPNNYQAICYKLIIIGTIPETFKGETKMKHKIDIGWELPTQKAVFNEDKGEQPFGVHKEFNNSSDKKSDLFKFLTQWTNGAVNETTIKKFDLAKLLGRHCLLSVTHNPNKNNPDIVYLEASGISSLPEGMPKQAQSNPTFLFDVDEFDQEKFNTIPEYLRKKIVTSEEFKAQGLNAETVLAIAGGNVSVDEAENQISGDETNAVDDRTAPDEWDV